MNEWTGRSGEDTFQGYNLGKTPYMETEPKPWTNERLARLSSEVRHYQDIRSYYMARVVEADREIGSRLAMIRDEYKSRGEGEPTSSPIDYNPPKTKGVIRNFHKPIEMVEDRIAKLLDRIPH